jgi:hypothetical protein
VSIWRRVIEQQYDKHGFGVVRGFGLQTKRPRQPPPPEIENKQHLLSLDS